MAEARRRRELSIILCKHSSSTMAWLQAVGSGSNSTTMVSRGTACRMLALRPLFVSCVVRPKGAAAGAGHFSASLYAPSEACRWEPAWATRAASTARTSALPPRP